MTFDFNGGATFDGQSTLTREGVSFAPILNESFLISCIDYDAEGDECHPLDVKKGKELDYVTVNGVRYEFDVDDDFMFNQDTTIKYFWTDKELATHTVEDEEGITLTPNEDRTFLTGTLKHLSGYALVGVTNVPGAPNTGKSINASNASLSLFATIGTFTIAGIAIVLKRLIG